MDTQLVSAGIQSFIRKIILVGLAAAAPWMLKKIGYTMDSVDAQGLASSVSGFVAAIALQVWSSLNAKTLLNSTPTPTAPQTFGP